VKELIFLVEESPEGGYTARALEHAIITEADSYEEVKAAVKEAVECHFEDELPKIVRLHFVKEEVFSIGA